MSDPEKSDLTVLTVVENDNGLIKQMIRSVYKFTDPKPNIIICDNGRNGSLLDEFVYDPNIKIVKNKPSLGGGSNRHGESLNKIFKLVKTKRTAIVESDCVLLSKNWLKHSDNFKMVTAEKAPGKAIDGKNYYYICFMVLDTKHFWGIDWRPGKDGNRKNRPYSLHEDVAWRVREYIKDSDVKKIQWIDTKTGNGQVFDGRFCSDEFWIDGEAVVAHYGRGSHMGGKAIRKGFLPHKEQLALFKSIATSFIDD